MGIEQNPNRTRSHIFSQTNRTEWTRTVWQIEPEPNCHTGRTEQNPNFMHWVRFTSLLVGRGSGVRVSVSFQKKLPAGFCTTATKTGRVLRHGGL